MISKSVKKKYLKNRKCVDDLSDGFKKINSVLIDFYLPVSAFFKNFFHYQLTLQIFSSQKNICLLVANFKNLLKK